MNAVYNYFYPPVKEEPRSAFSSAMNKVVDALPKHDRIPEQVTRLALNGLQFAEHIGNGLSRSGQLSRTLLRSSLIPLIWLEFPVKAIEFEKSAFQVKESFQSGTWWDVGERSLVATKRALSSLGTITESIKLLARENLVVIGARQTVFLTTLGVIGASIMLFNSVSDVQQTSRGLFEEKAGSPKFNVAFLKTIAKVAPFASSVLFLVHLSCL